MAKNKQKVAATVTRGKAILHDLVLDDHDGSIILDFQATKSDVFSCSSSPALPPMPLPTANAVCPDVLTPIPEVASGFNLLEDVTIEDCSEDEALVEALLKED